MPLPCEVGRFASSIVHDLKNPLTIIGIAAEVACLDTSTAEARHTAARRAVEEAYARLEALID